MKTNDSAWIWGQLGRSPRGFDGIGAITGGSARIKVLRQVFSHLRNAHNTYYVTLRYRGGEAAGNRVDLICILGYAPDFSPRRRLISTYLDASH